MTDILYALIAIICAVMLEILLNRTLKLKTAESSDRAFAAFLFQSFSFCLIDAFWGLGTAGALNLGDGVLAALTFSEVVFGTVTAFLWAAYVDQYLGATSKPLWFIGGVLIVAQLVLLIINLNSGMLFSFENGVFVAGKYRILLFIILALFFVYSAVKTLVKFLGLKGEYGRKRCLAVLFCSLIPIVLGTFKVLYPIGPFCAVGVMMTAVIVYIFNISSEYEHLITLENRITKMASRQNLETVKAIAQLFKKMTVIDLKVGRCRILKDDTKKDKSENVDKKAPEYLSEMVGECVTQEHLSDMQEFIKLDTLNARLAEKITISHEYIDKEDGWCRAYFIKINEDENHLPDEVIFAIEDIDDEKLAELEYKMHVEGENAIYREMLLAQGDGMIVSDMDNNIVIMNDAAGRMFGMKEVEGAQFGLQDLIEKTESEDKSKILDMLFALKTIGGRRSYEFTINNEDSKIAVMATTYVTTLKANKMRVVITSLTDISAKKSLEKALTAMSETDALTGISNRGGGEAKIMKLLEEGTPGMFALMDVDKFKSVNDTFGHGVGDKVLIEVAKCLVRSFRDQDVVMRLGGDEFAVYAKGIVKADVAKTCLDRLYKEVSEIVVEEMAAAGHNVTISLGAVICTKHQVQTFDELYQQADNVMYVSKRSGGNHYEIA